MIIVNKLIPMSVVDGPGNRFAIFLQGCNFNCMYCHNPETIHPCIHCGDCLSVCPVGALDEVRGKVVWEASTCIHCDRCLKTCSHSASPKLTYMTAEEILKEIDQASPFIEGITVSGGEATLQAKALIPLFKGVKERGLTALIDSNGGCDFSEGDLRILLDISDGVMLDIKSWDSTAHKTITGSDNDMVKKNLAYLAKQGKLEEVRFVLLDRRDNRKTVTETAKVLGGAVSTVRAKLISYRPFGVREKYLHQLQAPQKKEKDELLKLAQDLGFKEVVDI